MCEIEGGFHKTNIVRTSHSPTTFGDKAVEDSTVRGIRGGALGSRLCARYRSFGAVAVTSEEACGKVTQTALIRNDSDKEMNSLQATAVLEVIHHILLWAHHRVTTVRVCRPRIRPRWNAPACENCKANVKWGEECETERKITSERRRKIKKMTNCVPGIAPI